MKSLGAVALAAMCVLAMPVASAQQAPPFARLVLHSPVGDYIGGGQNHDVTYTSTNSYYFEANVEPWTTVPRSFVHFVLGVQIDGFTTPYANLSFSTDRLGISMAPGSYNDAERASFASAGHPGLDISFDHRGCNELSGSFRVFGVKFVGNEIVYFSASFVQSCERVSPPLLGWFVYYAEGVTPFADDPIVPGVTPVRALHIAELRVRTNAVRNRCGSASFQFTEPDLVSGATLIRAVHVMELRAALNGAYMGCARPLPLYSEPTVGSGMVIRADHIAELRSAVIMLE